MAENQRDRIAKALMRAPPLEEQMGNPDLDRLLAGGAQRSTINWRPSTQEDYVERTKNFGDTLRAASARINPDAFERAWRSWTPSQNIEVRSPPSLFGALGIQVGAGGQQFLGRDMANKPDAPGWEWYPSR
jgi:hypothetical protein